MSPKQAVNSENLSIIVAKIGPLISPSIYALFSTRTLLYNLTRTKRVFLDSLYRKVWDQIRGQLLTPNFLQIQRNEPEFVFKM